MLTLYVWLEWLLTRQTQFTGLTLENLEKLRYSLNGPDYTVAIRMDGFLIITIGFILLLARIFWNKENSSKDEA